MSEERLYHYMSMKHLIDIIDNKRLPLLNPNTWIDQNDAFSIKEASKHTIGALFFSLDTDESSLLWENYAKEGIGVCVVFKSQKLNK